MRFAFGRNWRRFIRRLDERRIAAAMRSLTGFLGDLRGRTFLDIGCGSGLFSLAAHRLGARVTAFDLDPDSVACAREVRRRFGGDWTVTRGSILESEFPPHDVVYAWGVLHHTGDLWRAMDRVARLVNPGGLLFVAVYNDAGPRSRHWARIKARYNRMPTALRPLYAAAAYAPTELRLLASHGYLSTWTAYDSERGMSRLIDLIDWIGGWPYEVSTADALVAFVEARGFAVRRLERNNDLGCHQLVTEAPRIPPPPRSPGA